MFVDELDRALSLKIQTMDVPAIEVPILFFGIIFNRLCIIIPVMFSAFLAYYHPSYILDHLSENLRKEVEVKNSLKTYVMWSYVVFNIFMIFIVVITTQTIKTLIGRERPFVELEVPRLWYLSKKEAGT